MPHQFRSETFQFEHDAPVPLERVFKLRYPEASWGQIRKLIESGKVKVGSRPVLEGRAEIAPGATVEVQMTAPRRAAGAVVDDELVVFYDAHIVVVHKPPGLSSIIHEVEPTSVEAQVRDWLSAKEGRRVPPLGVVHRLDKVTSGVMLFARTQPAKAFLKDQFRAHSVGRTYLAVAHGSVRPGRLAFRIVRDRGDGLRGVTRDPVKGRFSATNVEVVEQLSRCCLVRCRLETGRTHQIRIHLAHIGNPIVGEPLYIGDYRGEPIEAPRVLLHAATLSFEHPGHRGRMSFEQPLPAAFEQVLSRERALRR